MFGHVNNAAYYSYFDTAITRWLLESGVLSLRGGAFQVAVAENGCRYHSEPAFPGDVTAGVRMAHLGTSSFRHEVAAFGGDADAASAEGFFVHVCVSAATRRPTPLPEPWRRALQAMMEG